MPNGAPPGLEQVEEDEAKVVKVDASPGLRTDLVALHITVRASLDVEGFKQRPACLLQVSHERLRLSNGMGDDWSEHLATSVCPHMLRCMMCGRSMLLRMTTLVWR